MKRIIVSGANGQLGTSLRSALSECPDIEVLYTDITPLFPGDEALDITDQTEVHRLIADFKPDYVINAAAYTAVDKAESDIDLCTRLNARAPGYMAQACARCEAKLIHISTDYVFSGKATHPYKEVDPADPQNIYGITKYQGEQEVRTLLPDLHIILRTAWLYSHTGKNFVKTMLSLAAQRDTIGVVADQWGCPTYAPVLAQAILAIIHAKKWYPGTYHLTGAGRTTWYDFAKAIFLQAGITKMKVNALTTDQYPTPAHRPQYSVLDCSKFCNRFDFVIPDWQTSLTQFFQDSL